MTQIFFSLCFFVWLVPETGLGQPLRVLTWWNYIPNAVLTDLKKQGIELEPISYRSNDAAAARLSADHEDLDLAILSNTVIDAIKNRAILQKDLFNDVILERNYPRFLTERASDCIPYMWSTSAFVFSKGLNKGISSLKELRASKEQGFEIGIIDDGLEFAARAIRDEVSDFRSLGFKKIDFRSSITTLLNHPKSAAYGWSGEFAKALNRHSLQVSLGSPPIVIGSDNLCIIHGHAQRRTLAAALALTSFANAAIITAETQYFSPYPKDIRGLSPAMETLYFRVSAHLEHGEAKMISPSEQFLYQRKISHWRSMRYGR